MAFTCGQCGYRNSEVKGGGAVPEFGTEVRLKVMSGDDLRRFVFSIIVLFSAVYHNEIIY